MLSGTTVGPGFRRLPAFLAKVGAENVPCLASLALNVSVCGSDRSRDNASYSFQDSFVKIDLGRSESRLGR